jgi:hypothetical protein
VDEDEAAVDERPEVVLPADPHLVLVDVIARGQPHLRAVVLFRHGEEVVPAGEVDDLAVVGGGALRHVACVYPKFSLGATCARLHRR